MREHALDLKALFERHRWLVGLWLGSIPGPRRFDLMEWQLAAFAASGLSEDAHLAYHAFFNHTVGYMLQRYAMTYAGDEAAIAKMIATLEPDRHAHVLHHVDQHRNGDIGDSFEYTLDRPASTRAFPAPSSTRSGWLSVSVRALPLRLSPRRSLSAEPARAAPAIAANPFVTDDGSQPVTVRTCRWYRFLSGLDDWFQGVSVVVGEE